MVYSWSATVTFGVVTQEMRRVFTTTEPIIVRGQTPAAACRRAVERAKKGLVPYGARLSAVTVAVQRVPVKPPAAGPEPRQEPLL